MGLGGGESGGGSIEKGTYRREAQVFMEGGTRVWDIAVQRKLTNTLSTKIQELNGGQII